MGINRQNSGSLTGPYDQGQMSKSMPIPTAATFANQPVISAGGGRVARAMACGSTMNMRDLELRSLIKFLTNQGNKPKETHKRMNAVGPLW